MQGATISPLTPIREVPGTDGQMRLLDILGCAVDLLRHTEVQARQELGDFVDNVLSAAKSGRIHLALDEDNQADLSKDRIASWCETIKEKIL